MSLLLFLFFLSFSSAQGSSTFVYWTPSSPNSAEKACRAIAESEQTCNERLLIPFKPIIETLQSTCRIKYEKNNCKRWENTEFKDKLMECSPKGSCSSASKVAWNCIGENIQWTQTFLASLISSLAGLPGLASGVAATSFSLLMQAKETLSSAISDQLARSKSCYYNTGNEKDLMLQNFENSLSGLQLSAEKGDDPNNPKTESQKTFEKLQARWRIPPENQEAYKNLTCSELQQKLDNRRRDFNRELMDLVQNQKIKIDEKESKEKIELLKSLRELALEIQSKILCSSPEVQGQLLCEGGVLLATSLIGTTTGIATSFALGKLLKALIDAGLIAKKNETLLSSLFLLTSEKKAVQKNSLVPLSPAPGSPFINPSMRPLARAFEEHPIATLNLAKVKQNYGNEISSDILKNMSTLSQAQQNAVLNVIEKWQPEKRDFISYYRQELKKLQKQGTINQNQQENLFASLNQKIIANTKLTDGPRKEEARKLLLKYYKPEEITDSILDGVIKAHNSYGNKPYGQLTTTDLKSIFQTLNKSGMNHLDPEKTRLAQWDLIQRGLCGHPPSDNPSFDALLKQSFEPRIPLTDAPQLTVNELKHRFDNLMQDPNSNPLDRYLAQLRYEAAQEAATPKTTAFSATKIPPSIITGRPKTSEMDPDFIGLLKQPFRPRGPQDPAQNILNRMIKEVTTLEGDPDYIRLTAQYHKQLSQPETSNPLDPKNLQLIAQIEDIKRKYVPLTNDQLLEFAALQSINKPPRLVPSEAEIDYIRELERRYQNSQAVIPDWATQELLAAKQSFMKERGRRLNEISRSISSPNEVIRYGISHLTRTQAQSLGFWKSRDNLNAIKKALNENPRYLTDEQIKILNEAEATVSKLARDRQPPEGLTQNFIVELNERIQLILQFKEIKVLEAKDPFRDANSPFP